MWVKQEKADIKLKFLFLQKCFYIHQNPRQKEFHEHNLWPIFIHPIRDMC